MKIKCLAAAAILAAFGLAVPASAELVSVTYWGTVFDGYDYTGVFGPANTSLVGDSYVAHFVFDTARGDTYSGPLSDAAHMNYAIGGSAYGLASPAVSASVTVNGHSVGIPVDTEGEILGCTCQDHNVQGAQVNTPLGALDYTANEIYDYSGILPISITEPFTYDVVSGDATDGLVEINIWDDATQTYDARAFAEARLTRLSFERVESVPEPSTWAMMLLSFAGLGYAGYGRARRRHAAFAA